MNTSMGILNLCRRMVSNNANHFRGIVIQKELESGIEINAATVSKVQSYMEHILNGEEKNGLHFYQAQSHHRIFSLESHPNLVFKTDANLDIAIAKKFSMKNRLENILHAKKICRTHDLGLLVIPNIRLFSVNYDGKNFHFIAEQKMDINPNENAQEELFDQHANHLNKTIGQLALFIMKTGFSDVRWRNIPILNNDTDANGNRKIALIDLEHMTSIDLGLFGDKLFGVRGLVGCVNEQQGRMIIDMAKRILPWSSRIELYAQRALNSRKIELKHYDRVKQFYATKGIVTGRERIEVDLDALGLNLDEQNNSPVRPQSLGQMTRQVIDGLNRWFKKLLMRKS